MKNISRGAFIATIALFSCTNYAKALEVSFDKPGDDTGDLSAQVNGTAPDQRLNIGGIVGGIVHNLPQGHGGPGGPGNHGGHGGPGGHGGFNPNPPAPFNPGGHGNHGGPGPQPGPWHPQPEPWHPHPGPHPEPWYPPTPEPYNPQPPAPEYKELSLQSSGYVGRSFYLTFADAKAAYYKGSKLDLTVEAMALPAGSDAPANGLEQITVHGTYDVNSMYSIRLADNPKPGRYILTIKFARRSQGSVGAENNTIELLDIQ